jgi:hypothetical protein
MAKKKIINPIQEQYFLGGMFGSKTGGPGIFGQGTTPGSASSIAGMGAGMLGGLIPGQNKQGNTSIGGSAAKGALSGVAAGAMFGPLGMAVGGLLGGATSLFKAKGLRKSELEEEARIQQEQSDRTSRTALAQLNYSNSSNLPMAMGGYTDGNDPYIDSVLNANKKIEWVQRLFEKNTPSIQIPGQQGRSTHFMESGDGRVYPTIVPNKKGKLKYLGDKAYDYADSTKSYIQFPSDKEAQWFAENYKKGTGVLGGNQYAMGGNINPMAESPVGDFSHFATGGTHEENPYGGIPQGMSQDGKLRTVEAKESSFKFNEGKYIFSNRLIFE